jgi:DNA-binding PadR family transcriptional regulator
MHDCDNPDPRRLRAWRMAARFARHGGWGGRHRMGGGPGGGAFRFGKMFADGDLRLVVLALLADGPRHGYDIIKALETRTSGVYSPSPGVVYPTLTYLEEAGYAAAASEGNKRVYSITDAGRAHLTENRQAADDILTAMEHMGERMARARAWSEWAEGAPGKPALAALDKARRRLRALIADAIEGSEEEQQRLADILHRAADEALGKTQ